MAGWFSRMTRGGERAESEPVEFSVSCGCGNIVSGMRHRRMQVVVCRKCNQQICVMPSSPYPRPKQRGVKKKPIKPASTPLRELGPDDFEVISPSSGVTRKSPKTSTKPVEKPAKPMPLIGVKGNATGFKANTSGFKSNSKSRGQAIEPSLDEFLPVVPRAKLITPLRLMSLGMICLICIGGWWTLHRRAVHQAGLTFAETAKSGRAALANSDYITADQQFQKAVFALDLLGRQDREARQVRQLARETKVANELASSSLFELISESQQAKVMSGEGWQKLLKRSYQDSWFLFDTNGIQFDPSGPTPWQFSVILIPGEAPVLLRGDMKIWSTLFGETPPQRMVFAGQLEDIIPSRQGETGWELVLNPKTMVLWTDADHYAALGGVVDESTMALLKSQAKLVGIED